MTPRHILQSIAVTAMLLSPACIYAQELNESVTIEGRYAPDIIKTDKIYTFPTRQHTTLEMTVPQYSLQSVVTNFRPELMYLPATAWRARPTGFSNRGYADLNVGSWLNSDLSAGYRIIDDDRTTLSVYLQHNSTSLWKPYTDVDTKRFRYDETLAVQWQQKIADAGSLHAALSYHLRYFNYYSFPLSNGLKTPTQTVNDAAIRLGWFSPAKADVLDYNVNLAWRMFNYRSLTLSDGTTFRGDRENHFAIDGYLQTANSDNAFRLNGSLNMLTYNKSNFYDSPIVEAIRADFNPLVADDIFSAPKNYGLITLTPSWVFNHNNFHFNIGFSADLSMHVPGTTDDTHYAFFHIAPNVNVEWGNRYIGLYAKANGGSSLNTLASAADRNYYMIPLMSYQQPMHTITDARLGINIKPVGGFAARFEAGYSIQQHTPTGTWIGETGYNPGLNLHGVNMTAAITYSPFRYICAKGSFTFTPQHYSTGTFNGYDRPLYQVNASLESNPIRQLHLCVEYDLRAGRRIYGYELIPLPNVITNETPLHRLVKADLRNIANLNFRASYDITERISLSLTAINLLNRRVETLPGLPDNGLEIYGGLSLKF